MGDDIDEAQKAALEIGATRLPHEGPDFRSTPIRSAILSASAGMSASDCQRSTLSRRARSHATGDCGG
jgi:hypothetical protein